MHGNNVQRELGTDSLKDRVDGRDVAVEVYSRGQGRSTRAALPPSIGQSKAPTTPNPAQNHPETSDSAAAGRNYSSRPSLPSHMFVLLDRRPGGRCKFIGQV